MIRNASSDSVIGTIADGYGSIGVYAPIFREYPTPYVPEDSVGAVFTLGAAANGTITLLDGDAYLPRGRFRYTPNPGFRGVDSFTYTITDYQGLPDDPFPVTSNTATVHLYVGPKYALDTNTYVPDEQEDDVAARLVWNNDDDNDNGVPDYQELDGVAGEDDLIELKLDAYVRSDQVRMLYYVYFVFGNDGVRIWDSPNKGREFFKDQYLLVEDLPQSVWLEAVDEAFGDLHRTQIGSSVSGQPILFDHIPGGAVQHDDIRLKTRGGLTAYRPMSNGPNTGYDLFGKIAVPEADEEDEDRGAGIRINGDDDDRSTVPDWRESYYSADEDDLIEVAIDRLVNQNVGLRVTNSAMIVWASANKGGLPLLTSETPLATLSFSGNVFVEWADDAHGTGSLELVDMATGLVEDTLLFHTFHAMAIGLSGEFFSESSQGADIRQSGVFPIMRDMYESGYDAYMYNEDDVAGGGDSRGYGEVRQEIRRAVGGDPNGVFPGRFVTEIGLIGHSHGGGSVYDLSWRLNQDMVEGKIGVAFEIPFTAYIDAITQEHAFAPPWEEISAETRLPLRTQYHANYYQRITGIEGLYLNGDIVPGAAFNRDVNYVDWNDDIGQDLTHSTIDDSVDLRSHLLERYRNELNR